MYENLIIKNVLKKRLKIFRYDELYEKTLDCCYKVTNSNNFSFFSKSQEKQAIYKIRDNIENINIKTIKIKPKIVVEDFNSFYLKKENNIEIKEDFLLNITKKNKEYMDFLLEVDENFRIKLEYMCTKQLKHPQLSGDIFDQNINYSLTHSKKLTKLIFEKNYYKIEDEYTQYLSNLDIHGEEKNQFLGNKPLLINDNNVLIQEIFLKNTKHEANINNFLEINKDILYSKFSENLFNYSKCVQNINSISIKNEIEYFFEICSYHLTEIVNFVLLGVN